MRLIIGLGNPGKKYEKTRHNAGRMALEALGGQQTGKFETKTGLKAEVLKADFGDQKIILAKPLTFINNSGESVKLLAARFSALPSSLWVVHDDLDIKLGEYKIQFAKGPKDHGGLISVEKLLGTDQFWRVRIGVDNRDQGERIAGEEYVLQKFTGQEEKIIQEVIEKALADLTVKLLR